MKWRKMFWHALMLFLCFKSVGKLNLHCLQLNRYKPISFRYANRSARFISAYSQGLNGAEAVWANKTYYSHRTLPPWMVEKAKKHLHKETANK
jgi:hypothetical protein